MATILLPPNFKEFLQLLNSERIEYLLSGGRPRRYTEILFSCRQKYLAPC